MATLCKETAKKLQRCNAMASLMQQGDRYYCQFVFRGKRHCFPLGKVELNEAKAKAYQADYLLMRLRQGLLQIPVGMNIVTFLEFDGKAPEQVPPQREDVTLGKLRDEYLKTHRGSLEDTTIDGIGLHFGHLNYLLGEGLPLRPS